MRPIVYVSVCESMTDDTLIQMDVRVGTRERSGVEPRATAGAVVADLLRWAAAAASAALTETSPAAAAPEAEVHPLLSPAPPDPFATETVDARMLSDD